MNIVYYVYSRTPRREILRTKNLARAKLYRAMYARILQTDTAIVARQEFKLDNETV